MVVGPKVVEIHELEDNSNAGRSGVGSVVGCAVWPLANCVVFGHTMLLEPPNAPSAGFHTGEDSPKLPVFIHG